MLYWNQITAFTLGFVCMTWSGWCCAKEPSPEDYYRLQTETSSAELVGGGHTFDVATAPLIPPVSESPLGNDLHSTESAIDLPPLEQELATHGGSYLYEPIDTLQAIHGGNASHHNAPFLPECWQAPQPWTCPVPYLGSHMIRQYEGLTWPGCPGHPWEPRLVVHGGYEIFGTVYEQDDQRRDGIGHQLLVDVDARLTGTERAHVQFRPFGKDNSGGSFWQFSDPTGYNDNSTGIPQRWWVEGELQSIFGGLIDDPTTQLDVHFTAGKFPFLLHNGLLMKDEVVGLVVGKNTILSRPVSDIPLSNLNVQAFYLIDDVDVVDERSRDAVGVHLSADYRHAFLEFTYAHRFRRHAARRTANYAALSATQFFGPWTFAGRAMFKAGDDTGTGDGQLYVIESNRTWRPAHWIEDHSGIELAVGYFNLFKATSGWSPLAGGNFNRLRTAFAVNPLVQIATGESSGDRAGAAIGVQLFRHHQDESIRPELSYEDISGEGVWALGLEYQRQLTSRTSLDVHGVKSWSDARVFEREGVFASVVVIF